MNWEHPRSRSALMNLHLRRSRNGDADVKNEYESQNVVIVVHRVKELLLCAKGDRPLLHILLLLCDSASLRFGASSIRPEMGSHLPSFHHYHSQLGGNSEVVLLGAVRERDVVPPHQGDGDGAGGGEDSEGVGGDGEIG
ncbi:hypothetical protein SASPL_106929 [Salvia splendens]|uniref:Uncharacterized protein n=1 Tax=Salvia splendens TaxID=180675 RepID=A0A8X8YBG5_SALSN|nr:hypothetical protein SASPL_106929 [Salvia splendens]